MSAGNRKNPYPVAYGSEYRDNLERQRKHMRNRFIMLLVMLFVIGMTLAFGVSKATAKPAPIRGADCWHHGNVDGLQEFLSEGKFDEMWCRPGGGDFTIEIIYAEGLEEVGQLVRWFKLAPYKNAKAYCMPSWNKAFTITDLEDWPAKKRTPKQTAAYEAWLHTYAERNGCWFKEGR